MTAIVTFYVIHLKPQNVHPVIFLRPTQLSNQANLMADYSRLGLKAMTAPHNVAAVMYGLATLTKLKGCAGG